MRWTRPVIILLTFAACGEVLSLKSAMESYRLYMQDLVKAIRIENTATTADHAAAFRAFMGSKPHRDWQSVMEIDARTRYNRIAGHLQALEEDARGGSANNIKESFVRLRTECLDCHYINMKGARREFIEASVPGLD